MALPTTDEVEALDESETSEVGDELGTEEPTAAVDLTAVAAPAAKRKTNVIDAVTPSGIHEHPTQAIPATRGLPASPTEDTRHSGTATTPLDALRGEEIVRTRMFLKICIAIVGASLLAVLLAGGDPYGRLAVSTGCTLVVITALWMLYVTRSDPAQFTTRRLTITATLIALGAQGGVYYWGVVSPACALVLYGIYFFSFGASRRATVGIWLLCTVAQLAIAGPIVAGRIADRGLIKTTQMGLRDQVVSQLVVVFLYFCAFVTARAGRQTLIDAIDRLEKAVRAVSQRERAARRGERAEPMRAAGRRARALQRAGGRLVQAGHVDGAAADG